MRESKSPERVQMLGSGDGGAVVRRGIVLGDDPVFYLDDDAAFAWADEDALAGVVLDQRAVSPILQNCPFPSGVRCWEVALF